MRWEDAAVERAVGRLQALVRIPTVSAPEQYDEAAFDAFLEELAAQFPLLHERLEPTRVGSHGLLFRWAGTGGGDPVVLMAHFDVVPVEGAWTRDPFGAELDGGAVHGRGTLDDKGSLAAICEAVEALLAEGFAPARDVWLSFGCDEEVAGVSAREAVEELARRGTRPWFVLDEGGAVAHEAFPGVAVPLGAIGVTEKGVTSVLLRAEGAGGHASMPARNGPTARIARAITRLERSPMPASAPAPTLELFRRMAPHAPAALRPLMANAARLQPLLTRALLAAGPQPAAMARTTFAVTTLSASPAINVIAATATAGVNIRVMTGDTVARVLDHLRKAVGDDVEVELLDAGEPTPVSPYSTAEEADPAFDLVASTIGEVFPDAVPTPYLVMYATDSRHFYRVTDRVYRFAPFRMTRAQRESIHAAEEHLRVEDYLDGITWYRRLIERLPA